MKKPFVVTFAGPAGTSKTPIALYLSHTFHLPIIQTDAIRMEVREDLLLDDADHPEAFKEFKKRTCDRFSKLFKQGQSFINDSSADRSWKQQPGDRYYWYQNFGYNYFLISMDLSREFIQRLHHANKSIDRDKMERFYNEHQKFLELYGEDVHVNITDDDFIHRMQICETALREFLAK